jgi:hypothetical protein
MNEVEIQERDWCRIGQKYIHGLSSCRIEGMSFTSGFPKAPGLCTGRPRSLLETSFTPHELSNDFLPIKAARLFP